MQAFKNWWAVDTFKKQQLSHRHLLQAIDLFDMTKGFSIFHSVLPDNVDTVFFQYFTTQQISLHGKSNYIHVFRSYYCPLQLKYKGLITP